MLSSRNAAAVLVLAATIAGSTARAAEPGSAITLDEYIARVLAGPEARVLDTRAQESAALVEGAGLWRNPAIAAERQSGPLTDQTRGSQDFILAEIPLSFPGRLGAAHDAAVARADGAAHERRRALARLRLAATATFVDVVRLDRRAHALVEARALLAPVVDAAKRRAEAGESAGGDRLRLEVELARVDDEHRAAESAASAAHRRAEALAGEPLPAFAPAAVDNGKTTKKVDAKERADVAALVSLATAAEREASAASLRIIPDVTIGGGPSFLNTGSADFGVGYAVSLRVDVPLFDRGQGDAARARADKASAEASRAALLMRVAADTDVARNNAAALRDRASAYRTDVVPRAESLFASTAKAVEIGGSTGDVLALVDAARTLRETRTALIDLESDAATADAELLFTIGAWDAPQDSTP